MFGGLAATGSGRLAFATVDGSVLGFDVDSGAVCSEFTLYPCAPERVHVSALAADLDGSLLLGDALNRRIRRFAPDGRALALIGSRPTPGLDEEDEPGVLTEPCAVLRAGDRLLVACGGSGAEHGLQRFAASSGAYLDSVERPHGWQRAQGLARVRDEVWVSETEAGAIRRYSDQAVHVGDVDLHPDLRRPFRLVHDGFDGVLLLLAPESDAEQDLLGVARLDGDGTFDGWAVTAGERAGDVFCPFDLAVLDDGRFAVADLPLGAPPDVRVQLFGADGTLLRVLFEDVADLQAAQRTWFEGVLARTGRDARTAYEQARVHHYRSGTDPGHLDEARRLYETALRRDAELFLARLGLATLLRYGLGDPAAAEEAYRRALGGAGGLTGDVQAAIAACRHEQGDLDGAIELLRSAVEGDAPPELYHREVETLGTWFLERAGEPAG